MARHLTNCYEDSHCELIKDLMSKGKTVAHFCSQLDICRATFYNFLDNEPEFSKAYAQALELGEKYFFDLAEANADNPNFNYNNWAFQVGTRFGIGKVRRVRKSAVCPKEDKSIKERLSDTVHSFAGDVSLDELDKVTTTFNKIADIEEKTDIAKRVEAIAEKLDVKG